MTDEGYTQQPPLTSLDVAEFIAAVERTKKQIICAPDVYEQVRDAVYGAGLGIAYRVVEHPWLNDGQVLVGPSKAEVMDVPPPELPKVVTPPLDLRYGLSGFWRGPGDSGYSVLSGLSP